MAETWVACWAVQTADKMEQRKVAHSAGWKAEKRADPMAAYLVAHLAVCWVDYWAGQTVELKAVQKAVRKGALMAGY